MSALPHELMLSSALLFPPIILAVENESDRNFLTQVYYDYRNLMYKIALSFFPSNYAEAEDAFSSTLEKMCRNPKKLQMVQDSYLASYVASMTANTCRDRLRQMKRGSYSYSLDEDVVEQIADSANPYDTIFEANSLSEVFDSWKGLSDKDRDLLHMRYVEEKSVPEIAALLNVRESTVYSALFRAKHHLERHLGKEAEANEK